MFKIILNLFLATSTLQYKQLPKNRSHSRYYGDEAGMSLELYIAYSVRWKAKHIDPDQEYKRLVIFLWVYVGIWKVQTNQCYNLLKLNHRKVDQEQVIFISRE